MPLLSQEMRVVTAIFGIVGVVQIAGSLNVIADWCARSPCMCCVFLPTTCFLTRQPGSNGSGGTSFSGPRPRAVSRFVERARKRFMKKQQGLLKEAQRAGDMVRAEQAALPAAELRSSAARRSAAASEQQGAQREHSAVVPAAPATAAPATATPATAAAATAAPTTAAAATAAPATAAAAAALGLGSSSEKPPSPPPSPPSPLRQKMSQVLPMGRAKPGPEGAVQTEVQTESEQIAEMVRNETSRLSEGEAEPARQPGLFASRPRLRYAYDLLTAGLPCLFFVACCFGLSVVENVSYDCYDAELFPTHADLVAATNCWTGIDSFYYAIITLATIGYGDVTPHSVWGQVGRRPPLLHHLHRLRPAPTRPALTRPALTRPALTWPAFARPTLTRPALTWPAFARPAPT